MPPATGGCTLTIVASGVLGGVGVGAGPATKQRAEHTVSGMNAVPLVSAGVSAYMYTCVALCIIFRSVDATVREEQEEVKQRRSQVTWWTCG